MAGYWQDCLQDDGPDLWYLRKLYALWYFQRVPDPPQQQSLNILETPNYTEGVGILFIFGKHLNWLRHYAKGFANIYSYNQSLQ